MGFFSFYDIELASLISDMIQRSTFVTLILNCCFAGSVGRDGDRECTTFRAFYYNPLIDAACPMSLELRALRQAGSTPLRDTINILNKYLIKYFNVYY